jgi:hemerythrin-like domain-containing protein
MRAVESLLREHKDVETVVRILEAVAQRVDANRPVSPAFLGDLLEVCENAVQRAHVAKEEHVLFPALAARGLDRKMTVVAALTSQHEAVEAFLGEMRTAADAIAGGDAGAWRAFLLAARDYVRLVREHLRIENEYFYSLADRTLDPADDEALLAGFERIERVVLPPEQRARCQALLERCRHVVAAWAGESPDRAS